MLLAAAGVALALAIVLMAVVGPGTTWNQAFTFIAVGSLAGAFLTGLFAVTLRRERSPVPMLAIAFGVMAILFVGAEVGSSLLGFGH